MLEKRKINLFISMTSLILVFILFQNFNFSNDPGLITDLTSQLSLSDGNLVISKGQDVLINSSINVRHLKIEGTLRCDLSKNENYTIIAENISVSGKFICGNRKNVFRGQLDIRLKEGFELKHTQMNESMDHSLMDHSTMDHSIHNMGKRGLVAMNSGEIRFFGLMKSKKMKLIKSVVAGGRKLQVAKPVNWKVGDKILLTSSGFAMIENEVRLIERISKDKKKIILKRPLKYPHLGEVFKYKAKDNTDIILDERSYVENLTRNITIGPFNLKKSAIKGSHIMIMGNSKAQLNSVKIFKSGRMGELARYPFHWHQVGDGTGQFIKNSVILNSFQRCIVIHGTNNVWVKNNTCYNHFSHGIFLESGNETNNVIEDNLVAYSKRPPIGKALLLSDLVKAEGKLRRFPSPSSYWISNPKNIVRNNIAAGSEGTGFWMAFEKRKICDYKGECAIPAKTNTLEFNNNIAHSNLVGITWDGAARGEPPAEGVKDERKIKPTHYAPPNKPEFSNLSAYKNRLVGIYFRGDAAVFKNSIVADNNWSLFWAFSQQYLNSSIIGMSKNFREDELKYLDTDKKPAGIVLYDGPFELNNVNFFGFPKKNDKVEYEGKDVRPSPFILIGGFNKFENKVKNLYFSPEPHRRVNFDLPKSNWNGVAFANSLRDIDGTLHGDESKKGFLVVPKHDFNYDSNKCEFIENWNAYSCDYNTGTFVMKGKGRKHNRFEFEAIKKHQSRSIASTDIVESFETTESDEDEEIDRSDTLGNKFNVILDSGYTYKVDIYETEKLKNFKFFFQAESSPLDSFTPVVGPIIHIAQAIERNDGNRAVDMSSCTVASGYKVDNFRDLRSVDVVNDINDSYKPIAYYASAKGIYIKPSSYKPEPRHKKSDMSHAYYGEYRILCNLID